GAVSARESFYSGFEAPVGEVETWRNHAAHERILGAWQGPLPHARGNEQLLCGAGSAWGGEEAVLARFWCIAGSAELELERPRSVPEPDLVRGDDVPLRPFARRQPEVDECR